MKRVFLTLGLMSLFLWNGSMASGAALNSYSLLAWNDLGMHCMDNDYSVFSILPPYNNLHAQLINRLTGKAVTSGVTLT